MRVILHRSPFLFVLLLNFSSLLAQTQLGVPTFRHFSTNTYGAFNQIWSVRQDPQGLMYFAAGGEGSVLQFDGQRWIKFNTPKLGGAFSLDIDSRGRVWAGAYGDCGYLGRDSTGKTVFQSVVTSWPDSMSSMTYFWSTAAFHDEVFFCSFSGIVRYRNGNFNYFKPPPASRFYFLFKTDSTFWTYVIDHGLFVWDRAKEKLEKLPGTDLFGKVGAVAILPWKNDEKLVISRKQGSYRYNPSTGFVEKLGGDWPEKELLLSGAIQLQDGTYLLHSINAGLMILDADGRLRMHLTTADGLPTDNIKSARQSADGVVWLATENGIVMTDLANPVQLLRDGHGYKGSPVDFCRFAGDFFMSTTEGLYRVIPDEKESGLSNIIKVPDIDYRGGLLDGSSEDMLAGGGELAIFDTRLSLKYRDDIVSQAACRIASQKDTWILGGRNRLFHFDLRTRKRKTVTELNDEILSLVHESTPGGDSTIVWIGFYTKGVARVVLSSAFELRSVTHKEMPKGYTYLTTAPGRLTALTLAGPLHVRWTGDRIETSPDSSLGPVWTGTGRSVFQMEREDQTFWLISGGRAIGVKSHGNGWSYDSTLYYNLDIGETTLLPDGNSLWIGGTDGVARHDRTRYRDVSRSFPTLVRSVRVKGDSVIFRGTPDGPASIPVIDHELNTFNIDFSASDYIDLPRLEFSWKMDGFDDDWTEWSPDNRVTYTNLNEGSYTFRVRARNVYHTIGEEGRFRFLVNPPWYRTWWFRLSLITVISMGLWALYRYRVTRLLAMERLRVKIASDLHDDIGANLSKISMYSELVRHAPNDEDAHNMLGTIGELSRNVISSMSDIVWSIDARNDTLGDLIRRMKTLANELFEKRNTRIDFDVEGLDETMTLPILIKQNFYLIYKEALNNIFKYADASKVKIHVQRNKNQLRMTIQDDGRGLGTQKGLGGNGLKNMRMRAEALKGTLDIRSDHGVTVSVTAGL